MPSPAVRCGPASGLWPGLVRVVRTDTSSFPSPRPPRSASRRSVHHTLLSKKAGSIPSLAIDGVVVAVAVGGGRELLEGCTHRAPPSHVVPTRPAVHGLAVRRGAHVGLGRLRCLAHYAAPTRQAAQERAPAVQSVHQVVALLRGGVAWLMPGGLSRKGCQDHWAALKVSSPKQGLTGLLKAAGVDQKSPGGRECYGGESCRAAFPPRWNAEPLPRITCSSYYMYL